jgi:predicted DNA-binding ribbon-helix-helix protein
MGRISPSKRALRNSGVVLRSVRIGGRNISVSLEGAFWDALKEIAATHNVLLSDLVAAINKERQHSNLSSVLRVFVLEHYRALAERRADQQNAI